MKIASQLVSAAPDSTMKTACAEDSGAGFQNVFANANGIAAKNTVSPVPASRDASSPANSRTTETKKKDAASDQTTTAATGTALPATLMPVPVLQAAVLPVDDGADAEEGSKSALGASLTGQSSASTEIFSSLGALADGAASEAAGQDASIANGPIAKMTGAASKIDTSAESARSNGSLDALTSAANAPAADAAKSKSAPGDASVSHTGLTRPDSSSDADSNFDRAAIAAAQSIAAPMQFPALSSLGQMSGSQVALGSTAAGKSFGGVTAAGPVKGPAGSTGKAKPVSDDLRGKKSDDASSDQATVAGVGSAPFAARTTEAMAGARRIADQTQGAIDAAGLLQAGQASGHAAGQAGVQTAGQAVSQGAAAAQDGKAALDIAAKAAAGIQGPAAPDPMPGVSSAHLVQSANSSEMRLGMQSAEFGNISISTSLNHQSLSAQISIDHSELGRALAAHLPAIEEKLGTAYGVQAKVELRDSNNPSQSADSGYSNSGQQAKEQRQSQGDASQGGTVQGGTAPALGQDLTMARRSALTSSTVSGAAIASRLDIRI